MDAGQGTRRFMSMALELAEGALEMGELPIAAIVVLDDRIIGSGMASERRKGRMLGHAEMLALEEADRMGLSLAERRRATMYTTLEPCLMCMGAAMSFFLGEIQYGLESPADGAVDLARGWQRREEDMPGYRLPKISGGVMREESRGLFEQYVARSEDGPMRDWVETLVRSGGRGKRGAG